MRVSASVTASTRSPSSAVRRRSASTRSTATWSGESRQSEEVSPSSASGAALTSGVIAAAERVQLSGSRGAPAARPRHPARRRSSRRAGSPACGCRARWSCVTCPPVAPPWSGAPRYNPGCERRLTRGCGPWCSASRSPVPPQRPAMNSAAMLIAVSSGVRAPRSRPIGLESRASSRRRGRLAQPRHPVVVGAPRAHRADVGDLGQAQRDLEQRHVELRVVGEHRDHGALVDARRPPARR